MKHTVFDAKGRAYSVRPLTMRELIEIETRLGGSFVSHGLNLTYKDATYALACAIGKTEAEVLDLFDGPSCAAALGVVFRMILSKPPPKKRGSLDDYDAS